MKEAIDLIETVERTGKVYAYAENYCYMPAPKKIRELYRQGVLGDFEYGEGEYMHNCESIWDDITRGLPEHWRNNMHACYYCTHSIGPLIHISGMRPVKVTDLKCPSTQEWQEWVQKQVLSVWKSSLLKTVRFSRASTV